MMNYIVKLKHWICFLGEDAVEEQLNLSDLLAKKKNTEVKDAKRAVKNFFESEGEGEPEYECSEKQSGRSGVTHTAKLRFVRKICWNSS